MALAPIDVDLDVKCNHESLVGLHLNFCKSISQTMLGILFRD